MESKTPIDSHQISLELSDLRHVSITNPSLHKTTLTELGLDINNSLPSSPTDIIDDQIEELTPLQHRRRCIRTCIEFPSSSYTALAYSSVSLFLVLMNVILTVQASLNDIGKIHVNSLNPHRFDEFNIFFTVFFGIDLLIRGLVADSYFCKYSDSSTLNHRSYEILTTSHSRPFFCDLFTLADFLSVCPSIVEAIRNSMFPYSPRSRAIASLNIFRVARIFAATRHYATSKIMSTTIWRSMSAILILLLMLFCLVCFFSILLLYLEPCYAVDECTFRDATDALYYLTITITTVGYGDLVPGKSGSKFIGLIMAVFGAIFMAMPLAILGNSFDAVYSEYEKIQLKEEQYLASKQLLKPKTRKERITRAMKTKDVIAKELYIIQKLKKTHQKQELISFLCADSGQLALDLCYLFNLQPKSGKKTSARSVGSLSSIIPKVIFKTNSSLKITGKKNSSGWLKIRRASFQKIKSKKALDLLQEKRHIEQLKEEMEGFLAKGQGEVVRLHSVHLKECQYIMKAVHVRFTLFLETLTHLLPVLICN